MIRSFKTLLSPRPAERCCPPTCSFPGCERSTREKKPYCPGHVDQHAYVQELLALLEERDAEIEQVRSHGAQRVDLQGITAQELVLQLRLNGSRTVPRLARELSLEEPVVESYARALAQRGWVTLGHTKRGLKLVSAARLPATRPVAPGGASKAESAA